VEEGSEPRGWAYAYALTEEEAALLRSPAHSVESPGRRSRTSSPVAESGTPAPAPSFRSTSAISASACARIRSPRRPESLNRNSTVDKADAIPPRPDPPDSQGSTTMLPLFCPTGPHRAVRTRINPDDELRLHPPEQCGSGSNEPSRPNVDGPHPAENLTSSLVAPLACHSQRTRAVACGHPRTTPRRSRPAASTASAGSDPAPIWLWEQGVAGRGLHRPTVPCLVDLVTRHGGPKPPDMGVVPPEQGR